MDCHFLLQEIFPTQESNPGLPHCGQTLYRLSHQGSLCGCVLSRIQLFATPWAVAHQAPLSMGFPKQEYWGGLPCLPSGDLPDPGIEPISLMSLALAGRSFTTWDAIRATWEALRHHNVYDNKHKIIMDKMS